METKLKKRESVYFHNLTKNEILMLRKGLYFCAQEAENKLIDTAVQNSDLNKKALADYAEAMYLYRHIDYCLDSLGIDIDDNDHFSNNLPY